MLLILKDIRKKIVFINKVIVRKKAELQGGIVKNQIWKIWFLILA
jgi:hypothetical protein